MRIAALLSLVLLAVPLRALAWTNAHVRDIRARIELAGEGKAHVSLDLGVQVLGGWLERLELAGFEEDLEPAPEPALLTTEDGQQIVPTLRADEGVLDVRFEKKTAPRRGLHRLTVRYDAVVVPRSAKPLANGLVRVSWTLPGWEAGLSSSEVAWLAPATSVPVRDEGVAQEIVVEPEGAKRVIRFVRVHVPRSSPWTVAVDVPPAVLGIGQERIATALRRQPGSRPSWAGFALAGLALGSALFSRAVFRRQAARRGLATRAVFPPRFASAGSLFVLALLGGVLWPFALVASLSAFLLVSVMMVERAQPAVQSVPLGHFAPIDGAQLRRLRRAAWWAFLGRVPWADGTSVVGALFALGCTAIVALRPGALDPTGTAWGLGVLCVLPAWIVTSRFRLPKDVAERVRALLEAARSTLTVGCAMRLVWYVSPEATPSEPRLRVYPAARYPGLLRVEVIADSRRGVCPLVLSVVTESSSAADRWLAKAWPDALREASHAGVRTVHMRPIDDVGAALECLFEQLTRESERALSELLSDEARNAA